MGACGNHKKHKMVDRKIYERIAEEMPSDKRLFHISSGMGWSGKILNNSNGRLVLKDAIPFHGAPEGWPDLAGWTITEVTEDMVGSAIAVFTGADVEEIGELTPKQQIFRSVLEQMGGLFERIKKSSS